MRNKFFAFIAAFFFVSFLQAQTTPPVKYGGRFMLGIRSTSSLFTQAGDPGLGVGGQFRIRLSRRINTEWFADYINTDISGLGHRTDGHIGWSVMFYLREPEVFAAPPGGNIDVKKPSYYRRLTPYLLAGHCFDYTWIRTTNAFAYNEVKRWSSAVQAGAGVHLNVGRFTDLSLSAQYMMHLGDDVHAHVEDVNGVKSLHIEEHQGFSAEGHLLLTLSCNFRIADLW